MQIATNKVNAQFPAKLQCLFAPKRYKVLYGGRGGAKSWGVARALLIMGAQRPLRVLCAREYQNSIRDSVHKLLSDQVEALGLSGIYEIQNNVIKGLNGSEFTFEGLHHNVSKIKSYEGADIVWVEEAQAVTNKSWDILIPTIRKAGSEIWMTFNPEFEDDSTYQRFVANPPVNAAVVFINYSDNPFFPEVLEEERLALKVRDPGAYDHVWGGQCRQWLEGAIYANELRAAFEDKRILQVDYDPSLAVYTAWDVGSTDDTAIWWYQVVGGEIHIIESYAKSGGSPSHFASQVLGRTVVIDIINGEPVVTDCPPEVVGIAPVEIEHRAKYQYGVHWLPHDARAKTLAASGKSLQQQLEVALGYGRVRITPSLTIEDGIAAARTTFPRCWFDESGCATGLKALRQYCREFQTDGISLRASPKHDWSSHYADAFRYLAIVWREEAPVEVEILPDTDVWGRETHDEDDWMVV